MLILNVLYFAKSINFQFCEIEYVKLLYNNNVAYICANFSTLQS